MMYFAKCDAHYLEIGKVLVKCQNCFLYRCKNILTMENVYYRTVQPGMLAEILFGNFAKNEARLIMAVFNFGGCRVNMIIIHR